MMSSTILWLVLAVLLFWVVIAYNSLIRGRNRVKEAWSDIDVQLKRRHDLIPNLVETVKGYAAHEKEVFENVTKARSAAMSAGTLVEKGQAENMLSGALKSLFALAEAYPQLRAVESFTKLQDELTDTEDKIQAARRFYNSNVLNYNTMLQQFPTNIIAGQFKFQKEEFFQVENESERESVKVSF